MPAMEAHLDLATHVAIFPSPGIGHIIPLLELGRRLVSLHGLRATLFVITTTQASAAQSHLIRSAQVLDGLRLVELPPSSTPRTLPLEARIPVLVRDSLPSLRSALREASPAPAVLLVDIFGTDAFDVADELGMSKYLFFTTTAAVLAFAMYLPALDRDVEGEYADLPGPLLVPGCRPIRVHDRISPLQLKREDDGYKWFLHQSRRFPMARGILVNTCEEVEPEPLTAMREEPAFTGIPTPRLYPVGPVIRSAAERPVLTPGWLRWLDAQPSGSVLLVSFGSGGTLSAEQTAELAWGLELSRQRFLWVVRRPAGGASSAAYFTSGGDSDGPAGYLPAGFAERTEGRGFLVPSWAPQVDILGHPAVGGFLTHGGWNSVLESLAHGVAMIVWPLYAEQRMNAAKLEEELEVAVRVREEEGELVKREEMERVARLLMEGDQGKAMKGKAGELRDCFTKAVGEGGSSRKSLDEVAGEWKFCAHPFAL